MSDDKPWNTPDYWNDRFLKENTPWDRGYPSPSLVKLEKRLEFVPGSSMIVPGCGAGHEVLHFLELGYQVSAVDWSKAPLEDLRVRSKRKNLSVELLCANFFEIPSSWFGTFDLFVEHTFFCAIDRSQLQPYVEQVVNLLKSNGDFIGCFLINDQASERYEGGPPYWSSEQEIRDLFEPYFDFLRFELSPLREPPFEKTEWWAHFKRK